ncbi:MAG: RsmF rRNA methyltransferase first C-terminal domain-containing protein [Clostridia bacterium]|nr:RsmF rRNA methyltransferase first C-terminal domain-containing protein [Clostridia bacterium]
MALPKAFCDRMKAYLGEDADAFFQSLEKEPKRSFRVSSPFLGKEEISSLLGDALKGEIPFGTSSYYFDFDGIGNHFLHHAGAIYVQEPAAMAPVFALGEEKAQRILDLCASPGGKSLQAADTLLKEDGFIVSNEPSFPRRKVLMQNIERLGEKRALVTGFDARELPEEFSSSFDLIICDVPCSGEGMMRKNEGAAEDWSEGKVKELSEIQKDILESAAKAVCPGGRILYSTCTWSKEENEENIASFLEKHPDFFLVMPDEKVFRQGKEGFLPKTLRFYPHIFNGEGQFLAILRKEGEKNFPPEKKKKKEKAKKSDPREATVLAFLSENLEKMPEGEIYFRGEDVYLLPKTPFSKEIFASPGVLLGQVQKGRLIPHHRFFRAFSYEMKNRVTLSFFDERVEAYLRGEEIALDGKGYAALFAEKIPLGGVKASGGRGKNLYPKGLRKV